MWQQDIVDRHRDVFVRSYRGVAFSPGYPCCADGWRDIVARLVERVSVAAAGHRFHFTQIWECHGVLRVHWRAESGIPAEVDAIALAEARSACSCSQCGAAGVLFSSDTRLITLCPEHAAGIPVPVASGLENVHVVREVIGTKSAIVVRRYDRALDAFVSVSASTITALDVINAKLARH
jgi:hypothetical protein